MSYSVIFICNGVYVNSVRYPLMVDKHKSCILLLKRSLYCINYVWTYYSIYFLTYLIFSNLYFNLNYANHMHGIYWTLIVEMSTNLSMNAISKWSCSVTKINFSFWYLELEKIDSFKGWKILSDSFKKYFSIYLPKYLFLFMHQKM